MTLSIQLSSTAQTEDSSLVQFINHEVDNSRYSLVQLSRKNQKVKAKYFDGGNAFERYMKWKAGRNIILAMNGAYTDECGAWKNSNPVGLSVNDGICHNRMFTEKLGGLVFIYPNGGITACDVKGECGPYDISSSWDRVRLIEKCKEDDITIFQTHLLIFNDSLLVSSNSDLDKKRERRFLAGCSKNGEVFHVIVNLLDYMPLCNATEGAYEALKQGLGMEEIHFMVNLCTGCNNRFQVGENYDFPIKGTVPFKDASNLLVYYID